MACNWKGNFSVLLWAFIYFIRAYGGLLLWKVKILFLMSRQLTLARTMHPYPQSKCVKPSATLVFPFPKHTVSTGHSENRWIANQSVHLKATGDQVKYSASSYIKHAYRSCSNSCCCHLTGEKCLWRHRANLALLYAYWFRGIYECAKLIFLFLCFCSFTKSFWKNNQQNSSSTTFTFKCEMNPFVFLCECLTSRCT